MKNKLIFALTVAGLISLASSAYALTINANDLPAPDANGNINIKTGPNSGYILTPIPVDNTAKAPVVKTDSRITISGFDQASQDKINTNIQYAMATNPNITSATITKDSVMVNYKAPAKLFGFITIHMNINVTSDTDGRVKVKFPWYRFLVTTSYGDISEDMMHIFQHNQTDLEFTKKQDPAAAQGQIFVQISNVLKEKHD